MVDHPPKGDGLLGVEGVIQGWAKCFPLLIPCFLSGGFVTSADDFVLSFLWNPCAYSFTWLFVETCLLVSLLGVSGTPDHGGG